MKWVVEREKTDGETKLLRFFQAYALQYTDIWIIHTIQTEKKIENKIRTSIKRNQYRDLSI